MRPLPSLLAAVALTVSACSFSSVDPNATVTVTGRALDAQGRPLSGATVVLIRQPDVGQVIFGSVLAIGTLSTICLAPNAPAICDDAHLATTDSRGRYRFEVPGSETQGSLGTEATLNLTFSAGADAGSTTVRFQAKDTDVRLPDAGLWRARSQVRQSGGDIHLTWAGLPAAGNRGTVSYSAQVAGTEGTIWSQSAGSRSADIDPRLLEDRAGSVAAQASAELSGGSHAGSVRVSYVSAQHDVRATAGAPPSRGRSCAAVTGTGPVRTGRFSACAMTDGDLGRPAQLLANGKVVTGSVIDLGSVRPIRLVVARGFAGQIIIETSTDQKTYRYYGGGNAGTVAAEPKTPISARYVRVRSAVGLDESLASELSVW